MKPTQLPSGNWRVQVELGRDANGKRMFASVTRKTRKEATEAASRILLDKQYKRKYKITVKDALEKYISERESQLSPTTARAYRSLQKNRYGSINDTPITKIAQSDLQRLVEGSDVSPKTKRNMIGLLCAALRYCGCVLDTRRVLIRREKEKKKMVVPTHEQVKALFEHSSGELRWMIALAAMCGLRRSEIFALRCDHIDMKNKTISIDSAMIRANGEYIIKEPKTTESTRVVNMPTLLEVEFDFSNIDWSREYLMTGKMSAMSTKFERLRNALGFKFRFHDLRHYYASLLVISGVPKIYAMKMGGWSTPDTYEKVYAYVFPDTMKEEEQKANKTIDEKLAGLWVLP